LKINISLVFVILHFVIEFDEKYFTALNF
jgi:hypothetical protein